MPLRTMMEAVSRSMPNCSCNLRTFWEGTGRLFHFMYKNLHYIKIQSMLWRIEPSRVFRGLPPSIMETYLNR